MTTINIIPNAPEEDEGLTIPISQACIPMMLFPLKLKANLEDSDSESDCDSDESVDVEEIEDQVFEFFNKEMSSL